ncbi:DEAD/DEAH box helicase [Amycolatopsis sp. BJA-103]|uniref:DEAD/DEAH box helicase n=1 Tax=Amycolatopsis sp. BJA-103 TaxID=1911175 RepID=UPI000C780CAF|nr:helicase-related protein [Amycolatopsis sp. BJA-103]AUI62950.1 helicase [Amycolatopsis sp. BJA-103]PNE18792.1 helicase [Amycolatopsis sp. BJA-103]
MVDSAVSPVLVMIARLDGLALGTYAFDPDRIKEDANAERRIHQGGYGERQVYELVQNGADEMRAPEHRNGTIHVVLTETHMYCANDGAPISAQGADTILRMGVSQKSGSQIGRFGVGVKSVLTVTDTPQFFSRSGSFGFDAERSADEILAAVNDARIANGEKRLETVGDTPVLRLAWPLVEDHERSLDPVLDELMSAGAATVVRLPLAPGAGDLLGKDIVEFPRLFQVFSHHVRKMVLEDRRELPIVRREITVEHDGVRHVIHEARGGQKSRSEQYRVFSRSHQVSERTRIGAGELHDRVVIDMSWAVPEYSVTKNDHGQTVCQVPHERGEFWAFFPTEYATTLSGVVNAAWKTNEDRQHLLSGSELNIELLDATADLVLASLPDLVMLEDPAAYLPLLPGRAKESPNWACEYLTEKVWALAAVRPSLPDQDGVLRKPADLRVHPEKLSRIALTLWTEYAGRPKDWLHSSVDASGLRRGKVNHVLAAAGVEVETVVAWLEALVEDGTAVASAVAIRIVAHLDELAAEDVTFRTVATEARKAEIVLTESGDFVAASAGRVFRSNDEDGLTDDLVYVDRGISGDPTMIRELDRLGIREADAEGRFRSVIDQGFSGYGDEEWTRLWELWRTAGGVDLVSVVRDKSAKVSAGIRVRTTAGVFRPIGKCLLPGPVVPEDGSRDARLAVDVRFHSDDLPVLRELGMTDRPASGHRPENDSWFHEYHLWAHGEYCRELKATASRVQLQTVVLTGAPTMGSLHLFQELSDEGKAAFLAAAPEDGLVESWTRQIGSKVSTRMRVLSPVNWFLRTYGMVDTSMGLVAVCEAVGPQLSAFASLLPVAAISPDKARRLGMTVNVGDMDPQRWTEFLERVKSSTDDNFVGFAYALLSRFAPDLVEREEAMRCRVGQEWDLRARGDIAVATTAEEYAALVRENHPAMLADFPDEAERVEFMIRELGMRRFVDVIEKRLRPVYSRPAVPLTDEWPPLRQRLGTTVVQGCHLQWCSELEEVTRSPQGTRTVALKSARQDNTVLIVDGTSFEDALILVDREFGWNLGVSGCRRVIEAHHQQQKDSEVQARLTEIRESDSLVEKIAFLVGEENLRKGLPPGLIASETSETGQDPDAHRVAQLAYNAHDDGVLRVHAKDIAERFETAPANFDGGPAALRFVTDLGLPDVFAGVRIPAPPMREEAEGPTDFPRLHAFQEVIAGRLTFLLRSEHAERGMLSLPTAAGKTRLAAEGAIRWIREDGIPEGPILWISQTAELCEQAFQSWKHVWENVGPEQSLVIDRLWTTNSATPVTGRPHLVIATDAKLRMCLGTDEYAWLRNASAVFVDEAHVAISREYTSILEHLGLTHRETSRHLVGLTATPFRNDAELTRRLVQRFGKVRLDEGVFSGEPISDLQDLGVLARVEHRELVGADIQLDPDELGGIKGFLPRSAELRLAEDEARNKLLVEEIAALPEDWPVLVFATSVGHAKFLAAKLGDRGVRSAAIDSATPMPERRQRIESFRQGRLRALTNYGVLSQGFDAPATRAVVIARPVYSPNDYQQMIGRGLRGSRNGGKDTCLILDVRDNIRNFHQDLAFTKFDYLWQRGQR